MRTYDALKLKFYEIRQRVMDVNKKFLKFGKLVCVVIFKFEVDVCVSVCL